MLLNFRGHTKDFMMPGCYLAPDDPPGGGDPASTELDDLRKMVRERGLKIDALEDEVKDLQKKAVPEGATLLMGDDAELWKQIRGLEVPVADLKTMVGENATLKTRVEQLVREEQLRNVAYYANWNPNVLIKLDRMDEKGRIYDIRENDEGQMIVTVKDGGEGAELFRANEYAQANWPEFTSSLFLDDGQESGGGGTTSGTDQNNKGPSTVVVSTNGTNKQVGTAFVRQPAGRTSKTTNDDEIDTRQVAKGALDHIYKRAATSDK